MTTTHNLQQTSRDRDNSRHVRTHEKNLLRCVRRLGTIIQSIFCAQSGPGIRLNFWKWSVESRYPGALSPIIKTFVPPFLPTRQTAPGSPRMAGRVHVVVFEKFTSAYLFQTARENSCDYLLIIYTKNITTTTNFDSVRVFSSFNWLAETDYYLCQIQTFSRPMLSKSFSWELGNVQGFFLYGHQPVKDNLVYNNKEK